MFVPLIPSGAAGGAQVFTAPLKQPGAGNSPVPAQGQVAPSTMNSTVPTDGLSTASTAQRPLKRAEITFSQNRLTVKASNSSLNQILREIGRVTGMKITGGVAEERVFGEYGPASPADVLTKLLDGTGSNLLLLAAEGSSPGELVLTPRQGGPTPPNPNAPGFDDDSDSEGERAPSAPRGVTLFGQQPTPQAPPVGAQTPAVVPTEPATPGASAASGTTQSPNGVKTPLEIFQQLQQLRQQQQQPPQEP